MSKLPKGEKSTIKQVSRVDKPRKLTFKKHEKVKVKAKPKVISSSEDEYDVEIPIETPDKVPPPHIRHPTQEYHEFGEEINGYKFIKHKKSTKSVNHNQHHSIFGNDENPHIQYDPPREVKVDKYKLENFNQPNTKQTYIEYVNNWTNVKDIAEIPWPNEDNLYTAITTTSLKSFFGDDKLVWKKERVRWHPDNLNKIMELNSDNLDKVTMIFQMINNIWENEIM